jgi:hypothetical protein
MFPSNVPIVLHSPSHDPQPRNIKRNRVEEIRKLLPSVFKNYLQGVEPCVLQVLGPLWSQVVGKTLAQHSRPVFFTAGTLKLAASSPTWAVQLRHISEEIRHQINRYLGSSVVRKVVVRHRTALEVPWPEFRNPDATASDHSSGRPSETDVDIERLRRGSGAHMAPPSEPQLSPEVARILERSFAKYFSRRPALKDGHKAN